MDNIQTTEGDVTPPETHSGGTTESPNPLQTEVHELKETTRQVLEGLGQLTTRLSASQEKPEKGITPEQFKELMEKDPVRAFQLAVEPVLKQHVGGVKQELTNVQKQAYYDDLARKEFPVLDTDPEFKRVVSTQLREMVTSGEMTKDSPTLLYRAAQIAALKYKPKSGSQSSTTSEGMSGEAPRAGGSTSKQSSTSSQFQNLSKMFGIKNADQMKARWESHLKSKKEGGR